MVRPEGYAQMRAIMVEAGVGSLSPHPLSYDQVRTGFELIQNRRCTEAQAGSFVAAIGTKQISEEEEKAIKDALGIFSGDFRSRILQFYRLLSSRASGTHSQELDSYNQRILSDPRSQLDRREARRAMSIVLKRRCSDFQAGVFLIAMRVKGESHEELIGQYEALREAMPSERPKAKFLIDLGDPYDGRKESINTVWIWPAVLASIGYNACIHGASCVPPKRGVAHKDILDALGLPTNLSYVEAQDRLEDPDLGWTYIDQSRYNPALYGLLRLREEITKRPTISTLEKLLNPFNAEFVASAAFHKRFVEKELKIMREYARGGLVAFRGEEGSLDYSPSRHTELWAMGQKGEDAEPRLIRLEPEPFGLRMDRVELGQIDAKTNAEYGLKILRPDEAEEPIVTALRRKLILMLSYILHGFKLEDSLDSAKARVTEAIESGRALARLQGYR